MMEKLIAMRNSKKKGFTLIELIVVIAILAILAALAVPAYNGLKKSSAEQVAKSNVRTVYTAYRAVEAMNTTGTGAPTAEEVGKMLTDGKTSTEDAAGGKIGVTEGNTAVTWTGTINGYNLTATYTFAAKTDPISVAENKAG